MQRQLDDPWEEPSLERLVCAQILSAAEFQGSKKLSILCESTMLKECSMGLLVSLACP